MPVPNLDGPPPLPPMGGGPGAPSYQTLVGGGEPPPGPAGASQIGGAAVRMAMEIDQALKVLAQSVPALMPWAAKTSMELRSELGKALAAGGVPTTPEPQDNATFPGGAGNL